MHGFRSFQEIIDRLGVGPLAGAFGVPESHVRVMKARNSVPFDRWPALIDAAAGQGFALSEGDLRMLRARRFDQPRPAPAEGAAA